MPAIGGGDTGERRLHDLRLLAAHGTASGRRLAGQNIFDSGWEWGAWLSDVVAARAAWDPLLTSYPPESHPTPPPPPPPLPPPTTTLEPAAISTALTTAPHEQSAFATALRPVCCVLMGGDSDGTRRLTAVLEELASAQERLLVRGQLDKASPPPSALELRKLSG